MKAVYFGFPARSHTLPSLAIVRELVKRGVEVEYYSTEVFRPVVEQAGARFAPYPAICRSLTEPADLAGHVERLIDVSAAILPDLPGLGERSPALVLFDGSALWGWIAARQMDAFSAASITTFAFTRAMLQLLGADGWAARLGEKLERLNGQYGLALRDGLDALVLESQWKFVFTSRFFQPAGRFFDDRHHFVGPVLPPGEGARVEKCEGQPLAYVSLGTIFNRDLELLRRIGKLLVAAGWRVSVSLGEAGREVAGEWPAGVEVHSFMDQMWVLGRSGLFVTHAGMGSVSEALMLGVPMILVPQQIDQFLVARRTEELRAGIRLAVDAGEEEWRRALASVERERAGLVAAAADIRASFREAAPLGRAVEEMLVTMLDKDMHGGS